MHAIKNIAQWLVGEESTSGARELLGCWGLVFNPKHAENLSYCLGMWHIKGVWTSTH